MAVGIVVAVVGIGVVLVLLTRMQNKHRTMSREDLDTERELLKPPDMLELVYEEVQETGIDVLPGADGVDPTVLLKVWKRDGAGCAKGEGVFVLADGLAPEEVTEDTLRFECAGASKTETNDESVSAD